MEQHRSVEAIKLQRSSSEAVMQESKAAVKPPSGKLPTKAWLLVVGQKTIDNKTATRLLLGQLCSSP